MKEKDLKFKVLVVDNDPNVLKPLEEILRGEGYEVFLAQTPGEARELLERELIHLAIVDVRLVKEEDPHDKSGLDLCAEMDRTVARIIPIGYENDWERVRDIFKKPLEEGRRIADGFTNKNVPREVLIRIQQVLREKFEIIPERRIAVLTSGGDSPGMNAAIWAIVRTAMANNVEVIGVQHGFRGLVNDLMYKLTWKQVSDILVQGGTILGAARFPEFKDPDIRKKAVRNIVRKHISGLIVIGGDGSMRGAQELASDLKNEGRELVAAAIPGTIDNDLWGTDMSLGAASAANAMIEVLRNLIRPAQALRRIFVCEVMGRYCGYLALQAALGVGADAVIIPEQVVAINDRRDRNDTRPWRDRVSGRNTEDKFRKKLDKVAALLEAAFAAGKRYGFVILGEGIRQLTDGRVDSPLDGRYVRIYLEDHIRQWGRDDPPDVREYTLGHPVRGVPPCCFDICLGARLGTEAVQCILDGRPNVMVGWSEKEDKVVYTEFQEVVKESNRPPKDIWGKRPKWQELLALHEALVSPIKSWFPNH